MRRLLMGASVTVLVAIAGYAESKSALEIKYGVLKIETKIGTSVEDRLPVGVADSFPVTVEQVAAWTHVRGAKEPVDLTHVWLWNDKIQNTREVGIRSSSYRTWSYAVVKGKPGRWTFQVKHLDGSVIASKDFEVTPAP